MMTDKTFHLEIVTPKRIVFKGEVTSFSAPGVDGGFQVLHSHAPMLAIVKIGQVKLSDANGTEFHYAISGGFVEVGYPNDRYIVLCRQFAKRSKQGSNFRVLVAVNAAQIGSNWIDDDGGNVAKFRQLDR